MFCENDYINFVFIITFIVHDNVHAVRYVLININGIPNSVGEFKDLSEEGIKTNLSVNQNEKVRAMKTGSYRFFLGKLFHLKHKIINSLFKEKKHHHEGTIRSAFRSFHSKHMQHVQDMHKQAMNDHDRFFKHAQDVALKHQSKNKNNEISKKISSDFFHKLWKKKKQKHKQGTRCLSLNVSIQCKRISSNIA